jgi:hypothetical protein
MADRSVATTDTFNDFRREVNGTARDIGDIQGILDASGFIASSTDLAEAVVAINSELPEIKQDSFIFPGRVMAFEGATDDSFETTITFTEPTADRVHTLPDNTGTIILADTTDTSTNKTFTSPTITSGVFNTGVSGTAVLDEDAMGSDAADKAATQQSIKAYTGSSLSTTGSTYNTVTLNTGVSGTAVLDEDDFSSNSATKAVTQQSFKAYIDNLLAAQDLDFAPDSGTGQNIVLDSEVLTVGGGTGIGTSATGNALTIAIANTVATLTGSQTLTNKTFTSPTINALTFASGTTTSGLNIGANGIIFEGATADAHETTLTVAEPTQDNTITIPNATMTLITTATHASKSNHIGKVIASTISVADAMIPLAPVTPDISPTSAAVELNVVLKVSKVSVVNTDLSAMLLFIYPNAIHLLM